MNESPVRWIEGPIDGVEIVAPTRWEDQRGWLIEVYREDQLDRADRPRMTYVSETLPGMMRGPHEHRDQTDRFAIVGPGNFLVWLWDNRLGGPTQGRMMRVVAGADRPRIIVVPPGVVHAYRNVGDRPGLIINCPDRLYAGSGRNEPVDEIRYEDRDDAARFPMEPPPDIPNDTHDNGRPRA